MDKVFDWEELKKEKYIVNKLINLVPIATKYKQKYYISVQSVESEIILIVLMVSIEKKIK